VGRSCHYMHFYTATGSMYQSLNNHQVLKSFVLDKECMFRFINKLCNFYPAVIATPYQVEIRSRVKIYSVPVRLETKDDFFDFMGMVCYDGIVPSFSKIFGLPV